MWWLAIWLFVSFPLALLVGACIRFGQQPPGVTAAASVPLVELNSPSDPHGGRMGAADRHVRVEQTAQLGAP